MEPLCRLLQTWSGVWNGAGRSLAVALRSAGLFFVSLFCSLLSSSSPPMLLCCHCYGSFSYRHHPKLAELLCCIWFIFARHDLDSNEGLFCPNVQHQPPCRLAYP